MNSNNDKKDIESVKEILKFILCNKKVVTPLDILRNWNSVTSMRIECMKEDINKYFHKSKRHVTCKDLKNTIKQILTVNNRFYLPISGFKWTYNKGPLYRSRIVKNEYEAENWKEHKKKNEVYNPPSDKIYNFGRLNKPHQSLLYLSKDLLTSFKEINAHVGDLVTFSAFGIDYPFMTVLIGFGYLKLWERINKTSFIKQYPKANELKNIYNNFLQRMFTQKIRNSQRYNYKSSVAIAQGLMNPKDSLGWTYPSAKFDPTLLKKSLKHVDVCLKPGVNNDNLHKYLTLQSTFLVRLNDFTKDYHHPYKFIKRIF